MDARRKRILFRCNHRGMKETDRLLGGFAEARLAGLPDAVLAAVEALLDESDNDLYNWLTGKEPAPERLDGRLLRQIREFHGIS